MSQEGGDVTHGHISPSASNVYTSSVANNRVYLANILINANSEITGFMKVLTLQTDIELVDGKIVS